MTERDRALAVLQGAVPDRTPWYGDLSWWHAARLRDGSLPAEYADGDAGYLRMHEAAGVGIYVYSPFAWSEAYDETVRVTVETGSGCTRVTYHTPAGVLSTVNRDLPGSATSAIVEYPVRGPGDLPAVRWLWEHRRVAANHAAFAECDARWAGQGFACALSPVCTSPLQSLITRWAGIETVVALLYSDACVEAERTFEAMEAADDAVFAVLAESPARYVEFPENLSGEVTGRRLARRYALPYWRRRIGQMHAAGKRVGIHNDGTLRGSLPVLIEAGFDVVESATPLPVGDMGLQELRDQSDGRIIVWGGLPGAMFSPLCSDAEFEEHVRAVLGTFPRGCGFVLGVADQVPPDAEWQRICRVRDMVDRWG